MIVSGAPDGVSDLYHLLRTAVLAGIDCFTVEVLASRGLAARYAPFFVQQEMRRISRSVENRRWASASLKVIRSLTVAVLCRPPAQNRDLRERMARMSRNAAGGTTGRLHGRPRPGEIPPFPD